MMDKLYNKLIWGNDQNIEKNAFLWNSIGGIIMAGQSVLFLVVIARVSDQYTAGLFSIAYAIANLMVVIGRYNMHNYQVSDINNVGTFADYVLSRIITCTIMMIVSIVYAVIGVLFSGYTMYKMWVVIAFCVLKGIDAAQDVVNAMYQKKGRLDVAARVGTYHLSITVIVLCVTMVFTNDLLVSVIVSIIVSLFVTIFFMAITYPKFRERSKASIKRTLKILLECTPLFLGNYFAMYLPSCSKLSIDRILGQEMQAIYNYLFMPVFTIGLLSSFVFAPLVGSMTVLWGKKDVKGFVKIILKQIGLILGITIVVLTGAWLLGVQVLGWLYKTNLMMYRKALMILLLGGGIFALASYFMVVLTVVRKQYVVIAGYMTAALIARLTVDGMIDNQGVLGASISYLITTTIVAVIQGGYLIYLIMNSKNETHKRR